MSLTLPYPNLAEGAVVYAAEHKANYAAIAAYINGQLDYTSLKASAGILNAQLAQITAAGKVSGEALTNLPGIPSGAGEIPSANINDTNTSIAANQVVALTAATKLPAVDGSLLTGITSDQVTDTNKKFMEIVQSGTFTTSSALTVSSLVAGNTYKFIVSGVQNTAAALHLLTFNADAGANYAYSGIGGTATGAGAWADNSANDIRFKGGNDVAATATFQFDITLKTKQGDDTYVDVTFNCMQQEGTNIYCGAGGGWYNGASALTSLTLTPDAGTITGSWKLYRM